MTLIYIAKLVFYSYLHKIKQANERKSCQEPTDISTPAEPLSWLFLLCSIFFRCMKNSFTLEIDAS